MNEKEVSLNVGKEIKSVIDEKGLKCKYVAEKSGYTAQQLSDMFNGRKIITTYDMARICSTLNVTPNRIMKNVNDVKSA